MAVLIGFGILFADQARDKKAYDQRPRQSYYIPPEYRSDLDRYTERWRSSDRLAEQRITLYISALTVIVGIEALGSNGRITVDERLALWVLASLLGLGTWQRLVRAKISCARSIAAINFIRQRMATLPGTDRAYHHSLNLLDSTVPKTVRILSLPNAGALGAVLSGAAAYFTKWNVSPINSIVVWAGASIVFILLAVVGRGQAQRAIDIFTKTVRQ